MTPEEKARYDENTEITMAIIANYNSDDSERMIGIVEALDKKDAKYLYQINPLKAKQKELQSSTLKAMDKVKELERENEGYQGSTDFLAQQIAVLESQLAFAVEALGEYVDVDIEARMHGYGCVTPQSVTDAITNLAQASKERDERLKRDAILDKLAEESQKLGLYDEKEGG